MKVDLRALAQRGPPPRGSHEIMIRRIAVEPEWEVPAVVPIVWDKVKENDQPPGVFTNGEAVVEVQERGGHAPAMRVLSRDAFHVRVAELAQTYLRKGRDDEGEPQYRPDDSYLRVTTRHMFHSKEKPLPALHRVAGTPFFAPDGQYIITPGYHQNIGVYLGLEAGFRALDLPAHVTENVLAGAKETIFEPLEEFSFRDAASLPNVHALQLSHMFMEVMRHGGSCRTPLWLFDGAGGPDDGSGTGKGLCHDTAMAPVHPGPYATISPADRVSEFRYKLDAALSEGALHACLDNWDLELPHFMTGQAAIFSQPYLSIRAVGTRGMTIEHSTTYALTGNGVRVPKDYARRILPVRLQFVDRDNWKRRLPAFAIQRRSEIVHALAVLGKNWFEAGRPMGPTSLRGFEMPCGILGGVLEAAGIKGFLGNRGAIPVWGRQASVEDEPGVREFLEACAGEKDRLTPASDLLPLAIKAGLLRVMQAVGEANQIVALGALMARLHATTLRRFRVDRVYDKHEKVNRWLVSKTDQSAPAPPAVVGR